MELPWLSYSPDRQSFLLLWALFTVKMHSRKFYSEGKKNPKILLIHGIRKVRSAGFTWISQNLICWEFENLKSHSRATRRTLLLRHNDNQDFTQNQCTVCTLQSNTIYKHNLILQVIAFSLSIQIFIHVHELFAKERHVIFILLHFFFS